MAESRQQKEERERLAELGLKRCSVKSGCGEIKPVDEFGAHKRAWDNKQSICRICHRKRGNQYYKENKAARAAYAHQYRMDNLEEMQEYSREYKVKRRQEDPLFTRLDLGKARAKKAGVEWEDISSTELLSHWEQEGIDAEVCYYCKQTVNTDDLHLDHGIPLSKGGSHSIDNLYPCHGRCNLSKGKRTAEEYNQYLMQVA